MPRKRLTKEEFIERSINMHNLRYDYSKIVYIDSTTKISIKCPLHNIVFQQTPKKHLMGRTGCKYCADIKYKTTMVANHGVEFPMQSNEIKKKIKKTNMVRYGGVAPSHSDSVKGKMRHTCFKNYGVENPSNSKLLKSKRKDTMIERYGVENAFQSHIIKEKAKQTCLKNYGVEFSMQSEEVREKAKQTMIERHGVENASQSEEIKKKKKQTCLKNYGVEFSMQSEEVREKAKQTCLNRYGMEYYVQKEFTKNTLNKINNKQWMFEQHIIQKKSLLQISYELKIHNTTVGKYLHKHGIDTQYFFQSMGEKELVKFIDDMGYSTILNIRTIIPPLEIDIFVPELNIALEYNGLYWHQGRGINYHKNKTNLCKEQKIHLIHIWEDQWIDDNVNIKNKIKTALMNKPCQSLNNQIKIDLSFENPDIYIDLNYQLLEEIPPQLYSKGIWDCGNAIFQLKK